MKKLIIIDEEVDLNESSMSRLYSYSTEEGMDFAIVSAYLGTLDKVTNNTREKQLKADVRNLGYGFNELTSRYTDFGTENELEIDGAFEGVTVEEESLFIPQISFEEALDLGKKYGQESIVYKNNEMFGIYDSESAESYVEFKQGMSMSEEDLDKYFSQFKKGGQNKKKKYSFTD